MKGRSLRPFISLLVLVAVAATLSHRIAIHRGIYSFTLQYEVVFSVLPVFNETLLKYAAIDMSENQRKKDVQVLLEGNFGNPGQYGRMDIRERMVRGLPLVLRSPNSHRVFLDFRKNLWIWWQNNSFQSEIITELVDRIRVPIDPQNGKKYSSCAVVGNSGILLNSEHGKLIDSHKVVIRLNNARVNGYEKKVGSKTSISFINSNILHSCARREGCFCHPYGQKVPIVMYICQLGHLLDYTLCNCSHIAPLIVTDLRFDLLCTRIVKYYSLKRFVEIDRRPVEEWDGAHDGEMFHYSSGMQAVMLAVGACERVSVFGFGKLSSAKHHYHTNQKAELHLHDYEAEYDFYSDLVDRPKAVPFVPDTFEFPPVVMYR